MKRNPVTRLLAILVIAVMLVAGCGGQENPLKSDRGAQTRQEPGPAGMAHQEGKEQESAGHGAHEESNSDQSEDISAESDGHDSMALAHDVPEEAAAVPNPVSPTDNSISAGKETYTLYCAVCHGETGAGDGPGAAGLDPKPAQLYADHVQANSDGALFYIITHGRQGTAMPPWEAALAEGQRWNIVNYIRTLSEE